MSLVFYGRRLAAQPP